MKQWIDDGLRVIRIGWFVILTGAVLIVLLQLLLTRDQPSDVYITRPESGFRLTVGLYFGLHSALTSKSNPTSWPKVAAFSVISFLLIPFLYVGIQYCAFRVIRGKEVEWIHLLQAFRHPLRVGGAIIGLTFLTAMGFILLIVPGLIWGLRYMFAPLLAAHENVKAWGLSDLVTNGYKDRLFVLTLFLWSIDLLSDFLVANIRPFSSLAAAVIWVSLSLFSTALGAASTASALNWLMERQRKWVSFFIPEGRGEEWGL